jgi:hypothetical protein
MEKLTPAGEWDPYAFINACEAAARNPSAAEKEMMRDLQAIESAALFDWICGNRP